MAKAGDVIVFTNPEWARYAELGIIIRVNAPDNVAYEDVDRSKPSYGIRTYEGQRYLSWTDFCSEEDFEVIDHDEGLLEEAPIAFGPEKAPKEPDVIHLHITHKISQRISGFWDR